MEQDNNKRLDELFNQAKNDPSKVSFEETKEQFINSTGSTGSISKGGKLAQFSNLKIIIMISTISAITVGATMFLMSDKEPIKANLVKDDLVNEISYPQEEYLRKDHEEVVEAHFEKINLLPANLKEIYDVKVELALKIMDVPVLSDSLKRYQLNLNKSERNNELILDTAYRFPKLNAEEVKANNKQKAKMLKQLVKFDKKKYAFIPSGTLDYKNKNTSVQAFHMQTTEVTNLEFRTFLFDLLINGKKDEFLKAKPIQDMWTIEYPYSFNDPMVEHYFSHPAYDNYPVLAISRVAAKMYCDWLTMETNKKYGKTKFVNDLRIPTEYEWAYAARGDLKDQPYPWGGPYLRNAKGEFLANYMPKAGDFKSDGAFHTAKVKSYPPNGYGLYEMSGNVAEMAINENNVPITKGGSWTSVGAELQIDGPDRFEGEINPSTNIGFRPVITYLLNQKNEFKPYGMRQVKEELYVDATEATNTYWREYLNDLEKLHGKSSKIYAASFPDTTVWTSKLTYNAPYQRYYFEHPAYNNYPVVGVTYEQVLDFCEWRTNKLKTYIATLNDAAKSNYPANFKYRLPTKEEWELIAEIGFAKHTLKALSGKHAGRPTANFVRLQNVKDSLSVMDKSADVTAPVNSYWPNTLGCYNLMGNVAEMISEKGIAKGGSWIDKEEDVKIITNMNYEKPTSWLGFRCVLEVEK